MPQRRRILVWTNGVSQSPDLDLRRRVDSSSRRAAPVPWAKGSWLFLLAFRHHDSPPIHGVDRILVLSTNGPRERVSPIVQFPRPSPLTVCVVQSDYLEATQTLASRQTQVSWLPWLPFHGLSLVSPALHGNGSRPDLTQWEQDTALAADIDMSLLTRTHRYCGLKTRSKSCIVIAITKVARRWTLLDPHLV